MASKDIRRIVLLVKYFPSKIIYDSGSETISCFIYSAILVLYINTKLHFDESTSTAIMHANDFLVYFFTIIGAIIADNWWGAYKTITLMMVVYSFGIAVVSIAAIETLNLPTM